tara:strand:- start:98 stop:1621 length:1524 start_codon:yes stop_codon:yes gene_type:complete
MSYIEGFNRKQTVLFPTSIDEMIEAENPIRFIDVFVDQLNIVEFGFKDVRKNVNGRPPYHPADLLKLYIYGYMNKIRSSRGLEKECQRNIELMWLIKGLVPDHNTISNFRKDNPQAIKKVFRATVSIAKNRHLIGGILIAGDGTKLRAQNSKKNNYNERKVAKHLEYIETKLAAYNEALSTSDRDKKEEIQQKISKHKKHQTKYQNIDKKLKETGEKQISTSDPDSRQIMVRGMINEVAYNVQSTVDSKNKLPIDYDVTNQNDKNAMTSMVKSAIDILGNNTFDAIFDKGYHNAEEIYQCHELGIETHVAIPNPASNAPDVKFNVSEFKYNPENDTYTCHANQTLHTNGNWYMKRVYRVKQYKTKYCKGCELRDSCTKSKSGRIIERHEFANSLERNKRAIKERPEIYKQRQALVEHPFGTMKRAWGFDHIMTKKTMKHASADVGFIFIAYNLTRIINILGIEALMELFIPVFCLLKSLHYVFSPKRPFKSQIMSFLFFTTHFRLSF